MLRLGKVPLQEPQRAAIFLKHRGTREERLGDKLKVARGAKRRNELALWLFLNHMSVTYRVEVTAAPLGVGGKLRKGGGLLFSP